MCIRDCRHARIESPIYHDAYSRLLASPDRDAFYDDYDFEVRPTTDDQPFFFHFFKWRQTPEILDNLGRTWQPFGGSGYFVLVALLPATAIALGARAIRRGDRGKPWVPTILSILFVIGLLVMVVSAIVVGLRSIG